MIIHNVLIIHQRLEPVIIRNEIADRELSRHRLRAMLAHNSEAIRVRQGLGLTSEAAEYPLLAILRLRLECIQRLAILERRAIALLMTLLATFEAWPLRRGDEALGAFVPRMRR